MWRTVGGTKQIVDGKYDLKTMGQSSLEKIKDYTPKRAAEVIKETVKFVMVENGRID